MLMILSIALFSDVIVYFRHCFEQAMPRRLGQNIDRFAVTVEYAHRRPWVG